MKLIKHCAAIAVITLVTGLALDANAQQTWNSGYASPCSEHGGCQHGNESLELIPYGQRNRYGNESAFFRTTTPYRDSFRTPYQSSVGDYSGGCGYGGTCGRSIESQRDQYSYAPNRFDSSGRCPYQRRQFEQASYDSRPTYGNQSPYRSDYEGNPNYDTRPNYGDTYSAPRQRNFESYQQAPADRRPELQRSPAFESENSYGRKELRSQGRALTVPQTSTQIVPPPELPPQPSASRQSSPQLLPPTTVPNTSQSNHNHAGHENCDHDH